MNEITWNYVKDGQPKKAGRYLMSYTEGAVSVGYWNKQQHTWYFIGETTENGDPINVTTIYAWAELPKAAKKI